MLPVSIHVDTCSTLVLTLGVWTESNLFHHVHLVVCCSGLNKWPEKNP